MANPNNIVPFIMQAEGGYANNPADPGGETQKGITWNTWQAFFGNTHDRFIAMSVADWTAIYTKNYWNPIMGNQITSQRIADIAVDWAFNSGSGNVVKHIQHILVNTFSAAISVDGGMGPMTLTALNAADEPTLWNAIVADRIAFYNALVANNPSLNVFLKGWLNRVNNLVAFEAKGTS